ncbi:MAG TPA: ABC transporter ATP-binding protein [Inquilinus sp.]|nr:ABC transporter ATP-binding protein [Inquilinus sp.]
MTLVRVESVSRQFPGVHGGAPTQALSPVDLDIAENDFITLLGPSGCGKSTLLRIVAGLDRPSTGRVLVGGRPVTEPGPDRGVVFQAYTLFPWLSVAQNIAFGLREKGVAQKRQAEIVAEYVAKVSLRGFENHYPKMLSGGMQQRTAIARALANDPKILLLDEPFGALDPGTRLQMHALLTPLWRQHGMTVVMVTHDLKEAFGLGTRLLAFDKLRHDPQAPGRYGARVTYDLDLTRRRPAPIAPVPRANQDSHSGTSTLPLHPRHST